MFTGNEDHSITLQQAKKIISRYTPLPDLLDRAEYYSKKSIHHLLDQTGVVGFRLYYGKSDNLAPTVVIMGVKPDGSDAIPGIILNSHDKCPPKCSP